MNPMTNSTAASQRLLSTLGAQLATITIANGYFNEVGDIYLGALPSRDDVERWPVAVAIIGKEDVLNTDISDELLHKNLFVGIAFYKLPAVDVTPDQARTFQQQMRADVERLLGNNWQLNDDTATPNCDLAMVIGSEPFTKIDGQNYIGVMVKTRIAYTQDIYDPSIFR